MLTAAEGAELGLLRVDRNPKSIKEKNPIIAEWDSKEMLLQWRKDWADTVNRALEEAGLDARIDHRSYEDQGILKVGGVHLGPDATALERQGYLTELGDENRAIADANMRIDVFLGNAKALEEKLNRIANGDHIEMDGDGFDRHLHRWSSLHR